MKHALPAPVVSSRAAALFAAAAIALIGLLAWNGAAAATNGSPATSDSIAAVADAGPTVAPDIAASRCQLQSQTRRYLHTGREVNGVSYLLFENVRVSSCPDGILTQRSRYWEQDREPALQGTRVNAPINQLLTVTLPTATGGNGPFTYSLSPGPYGWETGYSFNPSTRVFTGTPTATRAYIFTYTVVDVDGDEYDSWFNILAHR